MIQTFKSSNSEQNTKENHFTYKLGIKFSSTEEQHKVFDYIYKLQKQSLQFLKHPLIMDTAIEMIKKNKSNKFGVAALMKKIGLLAKNRMDLQYPGAQIHQSTYYHMLGRARIYLDMVRKVDQLLSIMDDETLVLEWAILNRSPFLEQQLAIKLGVKHSYARDIIHSTSRKFNVVLKLPDLRFNDFEIGIDLFIKKLEKQISDSSSERFKAFVNRVKYCNTYRSQLIPMIQNWLNSGSLTWKSLIQLASSFKSRKYLSCVRGIIFFTLHHYGARVNLNDVEAKDLVSKPYSRKFIKLPSIQLRMSSKFVVRREGNAEELTQLARKHRLIEFKFPVKRNKFITGKVEFHNSVHDRLESGCKIEVFNIATSHNVSKKIIVDVVLSNNKKSLAKVKEYAKSLQLTPTPVVGLDINRVGEYMLTFDSGVSLPSEILTLSDKFNRLLTVTKQLQTKLEGTKNRKKIQKLQQEINFVHSKRSRLLKEIHQLSIFFTATVLIKSKAKVLVIEDLSDLVVRGSRGELAKAILSMPDDTNLYSRACELASSILGYEVLLDRIPSEGTSRYHYICGKELKREKGNWDIVKCEFCDVKVNTHLNAAQNIKSRTNWTPKSGGHIL